MGFWSSIGDFVSSVASKASSFLSAAVSVAAKIALPVVNIITTVARIVKVIAIVLDIMKPSEKIEELGAKVIQAADKGVTLESCGNEFEKYQKEIREVEIDPEAARKHPIEELYAAGIAFVQTGIEQKVPFLRIDSLYPLFASKNDFFTEDRVKSYVQTAMGMGYGMDKLKSYLDGTCAMGDKKDAEAFLHSAEQKFNPSFDKKGFERQVVDVKCAAQR